MKLVTVSLPDDTAARLKKFAESEHRTRSNAAAVLLSKALTGADRLRALNEIAAAELAEQPGYDPDDGLTAQQRTTTGAAPR